MNATASLPTPQASKATLPKGYMQDAAGRLVPIETIKPIDLARDSLVAEIMGKARLLNAQIAAFKGAVFGDIASFVELSGEEYGVKIGGNKGNVTLMSFDGRYKVQRAIAEYLSFDERLQAAKGLIDECITEWCQGSRPELQVLVNDAFQVDRAGNINTNRVLALRRLSIDDARWQRAMLAISEAVQVVGSKSYVRCYERVGDTGEYRAISLDVAGV
jgi:hypothetical protein